jgi:hypothetical protein
MIPVARPELLNGLAGSCPVKWSGRRVRWQSDQTAKRVGVFFQTRAGAEKDDAAIVQGRRPHAGGTGSIDILVRYPDGPMLLIENKTDAPYSATRERRAGRFFLFIDRERMAAARREQI